MKIKYYVVKIDNFDEVEGYSLKGYKLVSVILYPNTLRPVFYMERKEEIIPPIKDLSKITLEDKDSKKQ